MILLIGGEKGGSGKSCLAQNLAIYLKKHRGMDVLILDALDQAGSRESIKTLTQFLSTDSGRRCCVVITGREYAVDDQQFGLLADFPVARIERFTPEQQYEYLRKPPALVPEVKVESTDSEQDRRWKIQRSLSVLFPGYHAFQELLSFPVVLRLVR